MQELRVIFFTFRVDMSFLGAFYSLGELLSLNNDFVSVDKCRAKIL